MLKGFEYLAVASAIVFAICLLALMFFYASPPATSPPPHQQHAEKNQPIQDDGEAKKPFWEKVTIDPVAAFTLFLVVFTAVLSGVGVIQLKLLTRAETVAEKSANAAKESAEVAKNTLIASNRPWMSLDVELAGDLSFDTPILGANNKWSIPITYRTRNIGHSPATDVSFFAAIIPFTLPHFANKTPNGEVQGPIIAGTDLAEEIDKVCKFPETMASQKMGWGQVVFPDESISAKFELNGNADLFEKAKTNSGYSGQFVIVGCITYGSTLNSENRFRTGKAFHLFKNSGSYHFDLNGENVSINELGFQLSPSNGSFAN